MRFPRHRRKSARHPPPTTGWTSWRKGSPIVDFPSTSPMPTAGDRQSLRLFRHPIAFKDCESDLVVSWAQRPVLRGHSKLIPEHRTAVAGAYIASMAQVYSEDRGANYAIRD